MTAVVNPFDWSLPVVERLTYSVEEAAQVLGIGRGLAYELARTGRVPVMRLGRRMVVPRAQLEAMLESVGTVADSEEQRVPDEIRQ